MELLVSHEFGTGRDHFFYYGTASSGIYDGRGGFYIGYFVYDLCLGQCIDLWGSGGRIPYADHGHALLGWRTASGIGDHRRVSGARF